MHVSKLVLVSICKLIYSIACDRS